MRYSARGSNDLVDWEQAALIGGSIPENPVVGEPRSYKVDAWVKVDGMAPVMVSGVKASTMADDVRKALLKELGLPVKKSLIYKDTDGDSLAVSDFEVSDVYDGWCNLTVRLADGSSHKIHHMYFSEMNTGSLLCPPEFYVFDLETTGLNPNTAEIAEIAAIKVVGGKSADMFSTTVFIDGTMPKDAQAVNNITDDELAHSPHVRDALSDFMAFIGQGSILVGHNIKTFDLPIVERVAEQCGVMFGYAEAIDSLDLAKLAWPGESHKMDSLRRKLGLGAGGAHRALKDCEDELAVYLAALTELKDHPEKKRKPKPEKSGTAKRPGAVFSGKWQRRKAKEVTTDRTEFDLEHPAYGKWFVFSGETFHGHTYDECMQAVKDLGGEPWDSVTRKTNYLVAGQGGGAGKMNKAKELIAKGQDLRIIDDDEFASIVGWE